MSTAFRAPSAKARKNKEKITPPHSMSGGAVDENHRCKRQYPKELRQTHPPLKCLSSGAVDNGPMSYPLILWPTGQRIEQVDANAFPGSFERLSVGTRDVQRSNGWIPFTASMPTPLPPIGGPKRQKQAFFSGISTPSAISRVWRRGVCRALYAIQVVFFGLPPFPCIGGTGHSSGRRVGGTGGTVGRPCHNGVGLLLHSLFDLLGGDG
jgi:hypothetical protein